MTDKYEEFKEFALQEKWYDKDREIFYAREHFKKTFELFEEKGDEEKQVKEIIINALKSIRGNSRAVSIESCADVIYKELKKEGVLK